MKLIEIIKEITPISKPCEDFILRKAEEKIAKKGDLILEAGKICRYLFFIEKGITRHFYLDRDGNDVTFLFMESNHFTSVLDSYYNQTPSLYNIEVLDESLIQYFALSDFEEALDQFPELEKVYSAVLRDILLVSEKRIIAFQFLNAEERYQELLKNQPSIIQRVPLGQIASYLGINQATLSRIRAKQKL